MNTSNDDVKSSRKCYTLCLNEKFTIFFIFVKTFPTVNQFKLYLAET